MGWLLPFFLRIIWNNQSFLTSTKRCYILDILLLELKIEIDYNISKRVHNFKSFEYDIYSIVLIIWLYFQYINQFTKPHTKDVDEKWNVFFTI